MLVFFEPDTESVVLILLEQELVQIVADNLQQGGFLDG